MLATVLSLFAAPSCAPKTFFGIPSWWQYLYPDYIKVSKAGVCEFNFQLIQGGKLDPVAISLIGFGILDILLRLAGLVAVAFVVYGGIQYVLSQGEPEKTKHALGTIVNALIGMGITIIAVAVVSFVGHRIG